MRTPGAIIVRLEIDHDGDRIAGRVRTTAGLSLPFTGWLGLAAAIEQAMTPGSPPALEDDPDKTKR